MRVAFVGKGGSGKTTLSALFSLYLIDNNQKVALFDLDVNSHTGKLLGIETDEKKVLAYGENPLNIRKHLKGQNKRIDLDEFLKTTPPGKGSNLIRFASDDEIISNYSFIFNQNGYLFTTGSYTDEYIGASCHHSTQTIAENILWHIKLEKNEAVVLDCVAGNDSFANSLYYQDLVVFILKPEMEGIDVYNRYLALAEKAGINDRIVVVGNSVDNDKQKRFLKDKLENQIIGTIKTNSSIQDSRMFGESLKYSHITDDMKSIFKAIVSKATELKQDENQRLDELHKIHKIETSKNWVNKTYRPGLEDQIDTNFKYT